MSKSTATIRMLPLTSYERAALQELNSDLERQYPQIDRAPGQRAELVRRAMPTTPNTYELARRGVNFARLIHHPSKERFSATINASLRMLAQATTRKKLPQAVAA